MSFREPSESWCLVVAVAALAGCSREERTVVTRSPYGDLTKSYVVDGDFELTVDRAAAGDPPWRVYDAKGNLLSPHSLTGGRCVSGILCVALEKGQALVNSGVVVPPHTALTLTLAVKPDSGHCGDTLVRLLHYSGGGRNPEDESFLITDSDGTLKTDANGWCSLRLDFDSGEPRSEAQLQIYAAEGRMIVDHVVLGDRAAGAGVRGQALDVAATESIVGLRRNRAKYTQDPTPFSRGLRSPTHASPTGADPSARSTP